MADSKTADPKTDLDRDLAKLFAEQHASAVEDGHAEPEELLDYLDGALAENAARRIRDHLEVCRECSEALLDLETLAEPDEPRADGAVDFEMAAAWRAFEGRSDSPETRRLGGNPRVWQAAAAVFLAATVGLSWQVAQLRDHLAERDAPQANVPVVYLEPTRAGGGIDARLDSGREGESFVVFLLLAEPEAFAQYEVDVLGSGGEPSWTGRGLVPSEAGSVRIALTRGFLGRGEYQVRLFGLAGDVRELIDEYRIEVK